MSRMKIHRKLLAAVRQNTHESPLPPTAVLLSWEHGLGRSDLLHHIFPFLSMNQRDANDTMAQEQHFPEPHLIQQGTAGSVEGVNWKHEALYPFIKNEFPCYWLLSLPAHHQLLAEQSHPPILLALLEAGGSREKRMFLTLSL